MLRSDRLVDAVLLLAVVIDVGLVLWTAVDPGWWFEHLLGHRDQSPGEVAFLARCAAHWTAFALFQGIGLVRWRAWHGWLLLVAGLRMSDLFTDWTYAANVELVDATAAAGLVAPGLMNGAMALFLVLAWQARQVSRRPPTEAR